MKKKSIPLGIKVISIFYYLISVFSIIGGIILIIGGNEFITKDPSLAPLEGIATIGGIMLLAFGIFSIFVAKNLWKGKNWAKWAVIIISGLEVIISLSNIIENIITIIINAIILGYLFFSKSVKTAFA